MKLVITGGAGFIGSHVAEYYALKDNVEKVIIIDNLSRNTLLNKNNFNIKYNWNYLHKYDNIKFYEKDIKDFDFLKNLFKEINVDGVIHTAAQTAVTTSIQNPRVDFRNNVIGTFNLLEAIRISQQDPAIVFCSTNKVFGSNVNNCPVTEKNLRYIFSDKCSNGISEDFPIDLCEHTPYGTSKLCADLYFQDYGHIYGMKTAVFRMSCIYGPRQFGVEDQGWIAHFIISAILDKKVKIFGDGKQVRDILYISDLVNAFNLYIKKANSLKSEIFCIGGGKNNTLSILELIQILSKILKKEIQCDFFEWRPSDQKVYISDVSKAKNFLDWEPTVNPERGINLLTTWVSNNKDLFT